MGLFSDGCCCLGVVTSDHADYDTCFLAVEHCLWN